MPSLASTDIFAMATSRVAPYVGIDYPKNPGFFSFPSQAQQWVHDLSFNSSNLKRLFLSRITQTKLVRPLTRRRDRLLIQQYFAEHAFRCLQIGAGFNVRPGWLNTNWYPISLRNKGTIFLDAVERFPFPDASIDRIFSEHMIEHVPFNGAHSMLLESFRVLKPGGKIRISTPDMAFLMALLAPKLTRMQQEYITYASVTFLKHGQPHTALSVVNNFVRDWGHTYIFDRPTLEALLAEVGFVAITPCEVNESDDPELAGIEFPERMPNSDFLQLETMSYEATKPA